VPPPTITEFPNAEHLNELMIMGPITVRSACSHHLCPIMGKLWIGVMPNADSNLIGLSKYSRIADWIMSRPQIQEEAIIQLSDLMMEMVKPNGLAVVMEADHFCMHWRGVKDNASKMVNSVMRGVFLADGALRREFLSLINVGILWTLYFWRVGPSMTASTPGVARAFSVWIALIFAWAYGLRTMSK